MVSEGAAVPLGDYANQPDLPTGWAIRIKGLISIRTASYRPEAAMINSLVLHGNVPSWSTGTWTDDRIRREFDKRAAELGLELVPVVCVARYSAGLAPGDHYPEWARVERRWWQLWKPRAWFEWQDRVVPPPQHPNCRCVTR